MSSAHPPGIKREALAQNVPVAGQQSCRVVITSQPQNKRWRYKGEKAISQPAEFSFKITGVNPKAPKKALICVSLLTEDLKQHPHHVVAPKTKDGKNGKFKDICEKDYGCTTMKLIADGQELSVNFLAVAIIKKTAGDQNQQIQSLLNRRFKNIDPTRKGYDHATTDELKKINLNRARLCLQVFLAPDKDYNLTLEPVYTDVFCDSAHVPDLKIAEHFPPAVSASISQEMWIFIKRLTKINPGNMTVTFHNEQLRFKENAEIIKIHENSVVKVKTPVMPPAMIQAASSVGQRITVKITITHEGDESTTELGVFYLPAKPEAKPNYQQLASYRKRKLVYSTNPSMSKRPAVSNMIPNPPTYSVNLAQPSAGGDHSVTYSQTSSLPVQTSYQTANNQTYMQSSASMPTNQQNYNTTGASGMQYSNTVVQTGYNPANNPTTQYSQTTSYTGLEQVESDYTPKPEPYAQTPTNDQMLSNNPAEYGADTGDSPPMSYFHDVKNEPVNPTAAEYLPTMLFDDACGIGSEEVVQGILEYEETGHQNGNGRPAN